MILHCTWWSCGIKIKTQPFYFSRNLSSLIFSGKQLIRFGLDAAFVYKSLTFINIHLLFVDELFEKISSWELLYCLDKFSTFSALIHVSLGFLNFVPLSANPFMECE